VTWVFIDEYIYINVISINVDYSVVRVFFYVGGCILTMNRDNLFFLAGFCNGGTKEMKK